METNLHTHRRELILYSPGHADCLRGPPSLQSNGYGFFSLEVQRLRREATRTFHLVPTLESVGMSSTPPYVCIVWCSVRHHALLHVSVSLHFLVSLYICWDQMYEKRGRCERAHWRHTLFSSGSLADPKPVQDLLVSGHLVEQHGGLSAAPTVGRHTARSARLAAQSADR